MAGAQPTRVTTIAAAADVFDNAKGGGRQPGSAAPHGNRGRTCSAPGSGPGGGGVPMGCSWRDGRRFLVGSNPGGITLHLVETVEHR